MKFRCFACGWFTDEIIDEGPTPEEVGQAYKWKTGILQVKGVKGDIGTHVAVTCWSCFWILDPDMWTSSKYWDDIGPIVSSSNLPRMLDTDIVNFTHENPLNYPWPINVPTKQKAFHSSDPSDRYREPFLRMLLKQSIVSGTAHAGTDHEAYHIYLDGDDEKRLFACVISAMPGHSSTFWSERSEGTWPNLDIEGALCEWHRKNFLDLTVPKFVIRKYE